MSRVFTPPTECPVCGEAVPRAAKACPGCGADERSGWDEEATRYDGLDLPDETFVNDDTPTNQSSRKPARRGTTGWQWMVVAGILLVLFILSMFMR